MKDISPTLRRIDAEIDQHRREIFMRQARITQLEDSRKLFMEMAEADEAAAAQVSHQAKLLVPGSMAKPMLVVRKTTTDEAAPLGIVASGKRKGLPRLRAAREGIKQPRKKVAASTKMRERILGLIEPGAEPMLSGEIANTLGLAQGEEARKPLNNALYQLRIGGHLQRDDQRRYYRPASNGGAH